MIYVGLDDTDMPETRGTNQLAKALVQRVRPWYRPLSIVRHQLLFDPRVPYTSKNGSASIVFAPIADRGISHLVELLRAGMLDDFVPGSDPGLCVAGRVSEAVMVFGRRCQTQFIRQDEARAVAAASHIHLEGLGGTHQGIIGALAAVGLIHTGQDGRVVQIGEWPDDMTGPTPVSTLRARGVRVWDEVADQEVATESDLIDVGKHLRPNVRGHEFVVFVRRTEGAEPCQWLAQRRV